MTPKQVLVIAEGEYGDFGPDCYAAQAESLRRSLHAMYEQMQVEVAVEIVATVAEISDILNSRGADAVIFLTRGQLRAARAMKRRHPTLRVILLTALPPETEIFIVPKAMESGTHFVAELLFA